MLALAIPMLGTSLFAALMIGAGVRDLTTMTIPNALVLLLVVAYAALAPFVGIGPAELLRDVGIALAVLAAGFLLFAFGWIGGGDAKLAAAATLWLGTGAALPFLFNAAVFGMILTLALLSLRRLPQVPVLAAVPWLARLQSGTAAIPYGVALAAGALATLPQSHWFALLS